MGKPIRSNWPSRKAFSLKNNPSEMPILMQFHKIVNCPSGKDNLEAFPEGRLLWNSLLNFRSAALDLVGGEESNSDKGPQETRNVVEM